MNYGLMLAVRWLVCCIQAMLYVQACKHCKKHGGNALYKLTGNDGQIRLSRAGSEGGRHGYAYTCTPGYVCNTVRVGVASLAEALRSTRWAMALARSPRRPAPHRAPAPQAGRLCLCAQAPGRRPAAAVRVKQPLQGHDGQGARVCMGLGGAGEGGACCWVGDPARLLQ